MPELSTAGTVKLSTSPSIIELPDKMSRTELKERADMSFLEEYSDVLLSHGPSETTTVSR